MGLEDFEKELAESKGHRSHRKRDRSRSRERDGRKHHHHHHHRSSRNHNDDEEGSRHRHKRSRHLQEGGKGAEESSERVSKRRHSDSQHRSKSSVAENEEEDEWVEKGAMVPPPIEDILDRRLADASDAGLKRDAWMEAPSALEVDYVQHNRSNPDRTQFRAQSAKANYELKLHKNELNQHLRDLHEGNETTDLADEPAQHEVAYIFGDAGSSWRMTKLRNVYRHAKETGRSVDDVAEERYGDLRAFDDAREEERELDRRKMYGKDYVGNEKPSGELFQERKMHMGIHGSQQKDQNEREQELPQGEVMREEQPPARTVALDQTALNKLKAQMMKAKLRAASNAAQLEAEYSLAMSTAANRKEPEVVVLGAMENRMLTGDRKGEVKAIDNKRGRERGLVEENEDMSIEDMVRQEKRTKGVAGGEGQAFAERIAKDAKFDNDLDYMDENATKLSKHVAKSEINLRNTAISDFQKMSRILDSCALCHHEDTATPPIAPIVSLATRVYLTLPTEPEISDGGACIVPIQHRTNLLECDDDEWEEIRNFMKCLTRMYHSQGRDVIFYENAAHPARKRHAAMEAVPIPYSLGETAPAFFKEAILAADEQWTQHKPLIDTSARAKAGGLGKLAFRR
ncbi:CwfJ C-terminus 1-domain-containing protein-like protein [Cryomyces antarcticus]